MRYCSKCEEFIDSNITTCYKCGTKLDDVVPGSDQEQQAVANAKNETNGVATFLSSLGWIALVVGCFGALYWSNIDYNFNWFIFIAGVFLSCISGGVIIGLGEIINKLHQIELNTQK